MSFKPKAPRFSECRECRFYRYGNTSSKCGGCGAGEFFEEVIDDFEPDDAELMEAFRSMTRDDDE